MADQGSETPPIYTIGHSTRTIDEFVALLERNGVATLADVRTIPGSRRVPQFNREALAEALAARGIAYAHLPKLGGLRRGLGTASPNTGWRNASFRAYADYMMDEQFDSGMAELIALTTQATVAIMCAEAVPWRCHRSLIADALIVRGVPVCHITGRGKCSPHRLTPFAEVSKGRIVYSEGRPR